MTKDEIIKQLQLNPPPDERAALNKQLLQLHRGQPLDPDKMQPFNRQREEQRIWPDHERLAWIKENTIYQDSEKQKITVATMYGYLYDESQPHYIAEEFRNTMIDKLEASGIDASTWHKAQRELTTK